MDLSSLSFLTPSSSLRNKPSLAPSLILLFPLVRLHRSLFPLFSFYRSASLQAPLIYGYLRPALDKCVGMSHFTLGSSNPSSTLVREGHRLALGHPLLPPRWAVQNLFLNEIVTTTDVRIGQKCENRDSLHVRRCCREFLKNIFVLRSLRWVYWTYSIINLFIQNIKQFFYITSVNLNYSYIFSIHSFCWKTLLHTYSTRTPHSKMTVLHRWTKGSIWK